MNSIAGTRVFHSATGARRHNIVLGGGTGGQGDGMPVGEGAGAGATRQCYASSSTSADVHGREKERETWSVNQEDGGLPRRRRCVDTDSSHHSAVSDPCLAPRLPSMINSRHTEWNLAATKTIPIKSLSPLFSLWHILVVERRTYWRYTVSRRLPKNWMESGRRKG